MTLAVREMEPKDVPACVRILNEIIKIGGSTAYEDPYTDDEFEGAGDLGPKDLRLDGILMPAAAQVDLVELLEQAGPFGGGAAGPRVVMPQVKIQFAKRVGSSHLKLRSGDGGGGTVAGNCRGAVDPGGGEGLENHGGSSVHAAGRLDNNI